MVRTSLKSKRLGELRLIRESSFVAPVGFTLPTCRSPREAARFMSAFAAREVVEVFWILALNAQHRIILGAPIAITRGTLTSSLVHPREVFRAAIVAGAAAVILCHNHPSGDTTPSADDRLITQQLIEAGKLLDLPVHDHIIVCDGPRYTSFAESGLI